MSQVLDLRRSVQILRRHKIRVGVAVAVGLLGGLAYATVHPQKLTSTALVILPQAPQPIGGGPDNYMNTQVVIAGGNSVLSAAISDVRPAMSLEKLRSEVQVGSPTSYLISISAKGKVAADAEATANAVAQSYIAYVTGPRSPIGRVQARVLASATNAGGTGQLQALVVTGLIGALVGALIGVTASLAISRNDKRLRGRDDIANSIGIPVLASVPVARPSDTADWIKLLQNYKPEPVHAWRLRKALQQLTGADDVLRNGADGAGSSLVVLSLSSDTKALALGPQLAVFAASLGIPTALVIGPQQDANVAAALRTACASGPLPESPEGPSQLQLAVCDNGDFQKRPGVEFTVVVANVDGRIPQVPDTMRTTTTLLGVSAGAATADQLARVAVNAAIDGREIVGILVANPEPTDSTTGQISQQTQPIRHRLPTRLNGIITEIRR